MKKCHCVYQMPSVFCDENMTAMGLQLTKISLSLIGRSGHQPEDAEDSQIKYKFRAEIAVNLVHTVMSLFKIMTNPVLTNKVFLRRGQIQIISMMTADPV